MSAYFLPAIYILFYAKVMIIIAAIYKALPHVQHCSRTHFIVYSILTTAYELPSTFSDEKSAMQWGQLYKWKTC